MKSRVINVSATFISVQSRSFICQSKLLSVLVFIAVKMCGCVVTIVSLILSHPLDNGLAPDASSQKEFRMTNNFHVTLYI